MHARPETPFRKQARLILAAFVLAASASYALALLNDTTVKGAATNHIFSNAFGDSVDALSGQLYFQIPIGPKFAASSTVDYQVALTYSSKVWRYHPYLSLHDYRRQMIDGRGQAGVGFSLQLGRVFWKWAEPYCDGGGNDTRRLIVQLADGTEHEVFGDRTTDGSFIRVQPTWGQRADGTSYLWYEVSTPDGVIYWMMNRVGDPGVDPNVPSSIPAQACMIDGLPHDPRTSDVRGWYVTSIYSPPPTGSGLQISYEPALGMRHLIKNIHEMPSGRDIDFTNRICDADSGLVCDPGVVCDPNSIDEFCDPGMNRVPIGYVTSVKMPSFGRPASDPNAATYRFHYNVADTTNDAVRPRTDPYPDSSYLSVVQGEVFLDRIDMPLGGYSMGFKYEDPSSGRHIGLITERSLPTGAKVLYGHGRLFTSIDPLPYFIEPVADCGWGGVKCTDYEDLRQIIDGQYYRALKCTYTSCQRQQPLIKDLPATTQVFSKTVIWNPGYSGSFFNEPGYVESATWSWDRSFTYDPEFLFPLANPYKVIETDPDGNWTVHYFASSGANADPNARGDCPWNNVWDDGLPTRTESWLGPQGVLLRAVIREYEDDAIPTPGQCSELLHTMANRRVRATTTIDFEGGPRGVRVEESDWDGLGHYRVRKEFGSGGALYRTRRIGWNCTMPGDPAGECPRGLHPPVSSPGE